jgi:hypothetical protein
LEKQEMTDDDLDLPVWGAAAIAVVLNTTRRKAFYLLEHKLVDGTKIGSRWCSTPRRLLRSIAGDDR